MAGVGILGGHGRFSNEKRELMVVLLLHVLLQGRFKWKKH